MLVCVVLRCVVFTRDAMLLLVLCHMYARCVVLPCCCVLCFYDMLFIFVCMRVVLLLILIYLIVFGVAFVCAVLRCAVFTYVVVVLRCVALIACVVSCVLLLLLCCLVYVRVRHVCVLVCFVGFDADLC